jgi:hypothetical protein
MQFAGTRIAGAETAATAPARWLRSLATLIALTFGPLIFAENADARLDGQFGAGLFTAPIVSTVLGDWTSFEDAAKSAYTAQPTAPGGTLAGLFSRPNLLGGFAAGFLGAGPLGLLFGHSLSGELTGPAAILGLIFQLALVAMLVRLIWVWWRGDKTGTFGSLSPRQLADAYGSPRGETLPDIDAAQGENPGAGEADNRPRPLNT